MTTFGDRQLRPDLPKVYPNTPRSGALLLRGCKSRQRLLNRSLALEETLLVGRLAHTPNDVAQLEVGGEFVFRLLDGRDRCVEVGRLRNPLDDRRRSKFRSQDAFHELVKARRPDTRGTRTVSGSMVSRALVAPGALVSLHPIPATRAAGEPDQEKPLPIDRYRPPARPLMLCRLPLRPGNKGSVCLPVHVLTLACMTEVGGIAHQPLNRVARTGSYDGSSRDRIAAFKLALDRTRVPSTVRLTRGRDIEAACGQLATAPKPGKRAAAAPVA